MGITFRRYKEHAFDDIPIHYLEWMNRDNVLENKPECYFLKRKFPEIFGVQIKCEGIEQAKMSFGKHKGENVWKVPVDYVQWMAEENVLEGKKEKIFFQAMYPKIVH